MEALHRLLKIAMLTMGVKDVALKHNTSDSTFTLSYTLRGQEVSTAITADQLCDYIEQLNR